VDFYAHQDEARKKTWQLVLLFSLAVIILLAITNAMVAITYQYVLRGSRVASHHYSAADLAVGIGWQTYLSVSAVVLAVILAAIALKWLTLSTGGKAVAESMGGQLLQPNSADGAERRLINVVEEMAIASGMPVPPVYLLTHEAGINAFAAGNTPADAVIGVTRGTVENLSRDQLQGVVAHEFSHILNGDMRLNLRLVAVLHGILFIGLAGRSLLSDEHRHHHHYHGNNRRGGIGQWQLMFLGVGLVIVGWLGSFFGNWIKSAVNRQREFLADASAVQFTRNPEGLANALRIIGGNTAHSGVQTRSAEQYSHMFFDAALLRGSSLFATHPPLHQRIQRIKQDWDGSYIYESAAFNALSAKRMARDDADTGVTDNEVLPDIPYIVSAAGIETATNTASDTIAATPSTELPQVVAQTVLSAIPPQLHEHCHEPMGALAVLCGMLLSDDVAVREQQLAHIKLCEVAGLTVLAQHLSGDIAQLPPQLRLPLLELCLPMLRQMSVEQFKRVKRVLLLLVRADGRLDLAEWCVFQVVCHYVEPTLGMAKPSRPQYKKLDDVAAEFQLVLSTLAWFGHPDQIRGEIEKAFRSAADTVKLARIELVDLASCRIDEFGKAVNKLANCYPLLKPQLLKALVVCVQHDNIVKPIEHEIIHAIAAVMDCPLPVNLLAQR
jgi:Zn-dependent protease with chaperone function